MAAITEVVLTFSENLSDNALRADRKPKLLMLVLQLLVKKILPNWFNQKEDREW